MSLRLVPWVALFCSLFSSLSASAAQESSKEMKIEAQLVWGTNEDPSPDPKHKPVEEAVARKLKNGPFKWQHYYEVNRQVLGAAKDEETAGKLSKNCEIKVKNLGRNQVEISLFGKGKLVETRKQSLPKGELLIIGGNADNLTAWFVVLKQVE